MLLILKTLNILGDTLENHASSCLYGKYMEVIIWQF